MKSEPNTYRQKKNKYDGMLTIYGRKPVLEALQDPSISVAKIHMAHSNKPATILSNIEKLAISQNVELNWIDKRVLSRISRNSKQDQGIAADLALANYFTLDDFFTQYLGTSNDRFLILDAVTNPQNVGMIIRSAAAAGITAVVIPKHGTAELGPLVIKASAGAIFKCPIIRCESLIEALSTLSDHNISLATLNARSNTHGNPKEIAYREIRENCRQATAFVLGNETDGISDAAQRKADFSVYIPMNNGVESLNVAITAALIAFA